MPSLQRAAAVMGVEKRVFNSPFELHFFCSRATNARAFARNHYYFLLHCDEMSIAFSVWLHALIVAYRSQDRYFSVISNTCNVAYDTLFCCLSLKLVSTFGFCCNGCGLAKGVRATRFYCMHLSSFVLELLRLLSDNFPTTFSFLIASQCSYDVFSTTFRHFSLALRFQRHYSRLQGEPASE